MKHSESIEAIAKALAEFQAEVVDPKMDENKEYRTKTGRLINLKYASLASILKTTRPILAKHGVFLTQEPKTENNKVTITTVMMHTSGEWIEYEPFSMNAQSAIAQEIGSAVTYAKRYSLSAILGLGAEDDDDGNGATEGLDTPDGKPDNKPAEPPKPAPKKAHAEKPQAANNIQPVQNVQAAKNNQPVQKEPEPPKADGRITKQQQAALFHAANGNQELVKQVIMNHAYVTTAEIEVYDFEQIMKEIREGAVQQSA